MLRIRLKRTGRSKNTSYRIVVMESSQPRDGKVVDDLGFYNPRTEPSTFDINKEKASDWLKKGAQPSETIAQYFVKEGLQKSLKRGSTKPSNKKKTKEEEA